MALEYANFIPFKAPWMKRFPCVGVLDRTALWYIPLRQNYLVSVDIFWGQINLEMKLNVLLILRVLNTRNWDHPLPSLMHRLINPPCCVRPRWRCTFRTYVSLLCIQVIKSYDLSSETIFIVVDNLFADCRIFEATTVDCSFSYIFVNGLPSCMVSSAVLLWSRAIET